MCAVIFTDLNRKSREGVLDKLRHRPFMMRLGLDRNSLEKECNKFLGHGVKVFPEKRVGETFVSAEYSVL